MKQIIKNKTHFLILLFFTFLVLICENKLYFPLSVPWMAHLGKGLPILDMRFGYSANDVYTYFNILGEAGIKWYLILLWTIDLFLPFMFGIFLYSSLGQLGQNKFLFLPILAAALDYVENIIITVLIIFYPAQNYKLVLIASTLTTLKHIAYISSFLIVIISMFIKLLKKYIID